MERTGGVAQAVENLPRKHEVLNLNPRSTKKKKRKKR
jgi:transposase